jgi:hypothetical protein
MDWLRKLHEPFFQSRRDAEQYVDEELRASVPAGWTHRRSGDPLTWVLESMDRGGAQKNYVVKLSSGLDYLILTYGNSDHGAFNLSMILQRALVIESGALRGFALRKCIDELFAECKPNVCGLT